MTLKQYMDRVYYKLGTNLIPPPLLIEVINTCRREIAQETRCLECRSTCPSVKDQFEYRIPRSASDNTYVDCVDILDVIYDDGYPLEKKTAYYMRWEMQGGATGVPRKYAYFGGVAQPTGYIVLYPGPSEADKVIKIHAIQFPQPLIEMTDVCELNDLIQQLVIKKALVEFYGSWDARGAALLKEVAFKLPELTRYKVI